MSDAIVRSQCQSMTDLSNASGIGTAPELWPVDDHHVNELRASTACLCHY